jgi:hypothetical protein
MPRMVPSQVVDAIHRIYPWTLDQLESETPIQQSLNRENVGRLAALINLVEQIPEELLMCNPARYTELIASIGAIKSMFPIWQEQRQWKLITMPGFGPLHPITLIRRALQECPDEFPSPHNF